MALDPDLADRVRVMLGDLVDGPVEEKAMFGGLSFLVDGHLAVSASSTGGLLVRVPAADQDRLVRDAHVAPMQMGARRSRTWVSVTEDGVRTTSALRTWIALGVATAAATATATETGPGPR